MYFDIRAVQKKYGVNEDYHDTGTTIAVDDGTDPGDARLYTIWDGGGNDTIIASGSSEDNVIDLRNVSAVTEEGLEHGSHVDNSYFWIAYGAHIENAVGGSGNDTIYGSDPFEATVIGAASYEASTGNNHLYGGGGVDSIDGGGGDDWIYFDTDDYSGTSTIEGGIGADHIESSATRAIIHADESVYHTAQITDADNHFTFKLHVPVHANLSVDYYSMTTSTIILGTTNIWTTRYYTSLASSDMDLDGHADDLGLYVSDASYNDPLWYPGGNHTYAFLNIGEGLEYGDDLLGYLLKYGMLDIAGMQSSTDGTTSFTIKTPEDIIEGTSGDDTLTGSISRDFFLGGAGLDSIDGGDGDDTIDAGDGDDSITGTASGQDSVFAGAGTDVISYSNSTVAGGNESYLEGGAGNDTITATGYGDTIIGGDGNDILNISGDGLEIRGDAGSDVLHTAAQTLSGSILSLGDGNDTVQSATLNNSTLLLGDGDDVVSGVSYYPYYVALQNGSLIDGGVGDDYIMPKDMNASSISGGDGNDTLVTDSYLYDDVLISGGAGSDTITMAVYSPTGSNRIIDGGDGNDSINLSGTLAEAEILGGAGDDTITAAINAVDVTIAGGEGDDSFTNQSYDNTYVFVEGDGDDTLDASVNASSIDPDTIMIDGVALAGVAARVGTDAWALAVGAETFLMDKLGDDLVITRDGIAGDSITLQDFDDAAGHYGFTLAAILPIDGTSGADTLYGTVDADVMNGFGGADLIDGDDGDDLISGGAGADTINGGDGNDTITYESSTASINVILDYPYAHIDGDAQGDILSSIENIIGSDYNDVLTGSNVANILDGGDGLDLAGYSFSTAAVNVDLRVMGAQAGGDAAGDILVSIEQLYGSDYNDTLTGDAGNNILYGALGNDKIAGGAGNDTLEGRGGVDAADYSASASAVNVDLTLSTAQSGGDAQGDVLVSIEHLYGSSGSDTLTGDAGVNYFYTHGGNDLITLGNGDDGVESSGTGADTIDGGGGSDTVYYEFSAASVNVNLSLSTAQSGGSAQGDILTSIESVLGSIYNDTLEGTSGDNILYGYGGNDTLIGGAGADTLYGDLGSTSGSDTASYFGSNAGISINLLNATATGGHATGDYIEGIDNVIGSAYGDSIYGSASDNVLEGGAGADTIFGSDGNDTVSYASSSAAVNVIIEYGYEQLDGDAQGDLLGSIENIIGSNYDDVLTSSNVVNIINGGAGLDLVGYSHSTTGVNVDLSLSTAQSGGDAAGDILVNIEYAYGSDYDDTIAGNALDNMLYGALGNDTLTGSDGNDTLDGRGGDDVLVFGTGFDADTVITFEGEGASGGDVIYFLSGTGLTNFTAVQAVTTYNSGASTATIDAGGGNVITITGITQSFVAGDFYFS